MLVDGHSGVIAGQARVLAARKLGLTEVRCIELSHMTEAQRKAYVLADNHLALNAGWDQELLATEIKDLKGLAFDLGAIGLLRLQGVRNIAEACRRCANRPRLSLILIGALRPEN